MTKNWSFAKITDILQKKIEVSDHISKSLSQQNHRCPSPSEFICISRILYTLNHIPYTVNCFLFTQQVHTRYGVPSVFFHKNTPVVPGLYRDMWQMRQESDNQLGLLVHVLLQWIVDTVVIPASLQVNQGVCWPVQIRIITCICVVYFLPIQLCWVPRGAARLGCMPLITDLPLLCTVVYMWYTGRYSTPPDPVYMCSLGTQNTIHSRRQGNNVSAVQFTVYGLQCTVYTVHCTMYIVQHIVYSTQFIV